MKRAYNGIGLALIALLIFFASAFISLSTDGSIESLEDTLVQDVMLRTLGFWMIGFIVLAVLAVINYTSLKRRSQSYLNIFAIGAILNLVFALIGSVVHHLL